MLFVEWQKLGSLSPAHGQTIFLKSLDCISFIHMEHVWFACYLKVFEGVIVLLS
uniref:Uncharacterized protein n=1 Tax=Rhizophora mucronata TaxID=61149 RepID=A0A2P2PHL4_RHIMU